MKQLDSRAILKETVVYYTNNMYNQLRTRGEREQKFLSTTKVCQYHTITSVAKIPIRILNQSLPSWSRRPGASEARVRFLNALCQSACIIIISTTFPVHLLLPITNYPVIMKIIRISRTSRKHISMLASQAGKNHGSLVSAKTLLVLVWNSKLKLQSQKRCYLPVSSSPRPYVMTQNLRNHSCTWETRKNDLKHSIKTTVIILLKMCVTCEREELLPVWRTWDRADTGGGGCCCEISRGEWHATGGRRPSRTDRTCKVSPDCASVCEQVGHEPCKTVCGIHHTGNVVSAGDLVSRAPDLKADSISYQFVKKRHNDVTWSWVRDLYSFLQPGSVQGINCGGEDECECEICLT